MASTTTKALALVLAAFSGFSYSYAQTDPDKPHVSVAFDSRFDYTYEHPDEGQETSGFHGKFFNLMVNGNINSQLTYSVRQRLNKFGETNNDAFGATDWIYLRYQPCKNWAFSGGKQVVLIGGFEYDARPIDVFFASRFWNNIGCYQFGVTATYITNNGNHEISAQITNSPYLPVRNSCYSYNLYWAGKMGCYSTLWSVNLVEYKRDGYYANFIALGNRFTFDQAYFDIDFMNRATPHHKFIAGDFTVIAKASINVTPKLTVFAKGGYDQFKEIPGNIEHVDNPFFGGGIEFYPLDGSRDLRLHAVADRVSDNKGIKYSQINLGLTWRVTLLK